MEDRYRNAYCIEGQAQWQKLPVVRVVDKSYASPCKTSSLAPRSIINFERNEKDGNFAAGLSQLN